MSASASPLEAGFHELLDFAERLVPLGVRALGVCRQEGEYRFAYAETKQRARQEALRLSRELMQSSFVVAVEGGELRVYRASVKDGSGWRSVRGGLERPLAVRPLAPVGASSAPIDRRRARLSPLGA